MYDHILALMQKAASAGLVYLTIHATRELKNDRLTFDDVIYGDAQSNDEMAVVAKLGYNNAAVVITIFRLRMTDYDL